MLQVIAVYILAIVVIAVIGNIGLLLLFPIGKPLARVKSLNLVISLLVAACSNIFAVYVFVWLCEKLGVQAALAMLVIPYLLTVSTDFKRIKRGKISVRIGETYSENSEEKEVAAFLVRREHTYLIGDVLGLSVGVIFFL